METAARDAVELRQPLRPDSVHKLSKKITFPAKQMEMDKACFRCDRANHTPDQCHFKDETCRFCSKKGHIERACFSKKAQQNRNQSNKHKYPKTKNNNYKFRSFKSKENIHKKEVGPYRGFGY